MKYKELIMNKDEYEYTIKRLANEIVECNKGIHNLCIIGIARRGVNIANDICKIISMNYANVQQGKLDITFYKDDLTKIDDNPVLNSIDIGCDINDKNIVLVDDVLYTGETLHIALDTLLKIGKPKCIKFCALIDRGHHTLPYFAEHIGRFVQTKDNEVIKVKCLELDGHNCTELHEIIS